MRNCNMPNCNMTRFDMSRNMTGNLSGDMERYLSNRDSNCTCDDYPIGMGYVPWQEFRNLYDPERGFHAGTIFIELDKPFTGRRSVRR